MNIFDLKKHIDMAVCDAMDGRSMLNQEALSVPGMSSLPNRHVLNNILNHKLFPLRGYLEIGVHMGSTFVAALFNNTVGHTYAIDNFSQFADDQTQIFFNSNCEKLGINNYTLFTQDCMAVRLDNIADPIDVFLYDGHHGEEETRQALLYYYPVLHNTFVYIVDDYDWVGVRNGVRRGILELDLICEYSIRLRSDYCGDASGWWNGLFVSILTKHG